MRKKIGYREIENATLTSLIQGLAELQNKVPAESVVYVLYTGTPHEYLRRATLYEETLSDKSKVYDIDLV